MNKGQRCKGINKKRYKRTNKIKTKYFMLLLCILGVAFICHTILSTSMRYHSNIFANVTGNVKENRSSTYNVIFNANGGTGTMQNQTIKYAETKNLSANLFTRTGYTFNGWNTKADGSGIAYADEAEINITDIQENNTYNLYAQWTPNVYKVNLDPNSGTGGTTTIYEKYGIGWYSDEQCTNRITNITRPSKTGYALEGYFIGERTYTWIDFKGEIKAGLKDTSINNTTLIARWAEANYGEYNSSGVWQNGYLTLADATEGATSGNTIKPLKTLTDSSTENPTIDSAKTIKLDLAGFEVTTDTYLINNGTLDIYSSKNGGILYSSKIAVVINNGALTTNGTSDANTVSLINTSTTSTEDRYVISSEQNTTTTLNSNSILTFNNASTSGSSYRCVMLNRGTTTVNGANLINKVGGTVKECGIVTPYQTNGSSVSGRIIFNSGTVETSGYAIWNNGSKKNTTDEPAIKITGGTIKTVGTSSSVRTINCISDSMIYITGGEIIGSAMQQNDNGTYTGQYVIGTTGNLVMTGGKVRSEASCAVLINGNGTTKVTGGTIEKDKNTSTGTDKWLGGACFQMGGTGTVTISGTAVVKNYSGNASNVIHNGGIGTVEITGSATVKNEGNSRAVTNASTGKIKVSGTATVKSERGIILGNDYGSGELGSAGTIEIQGGTLSTTADTGIQNTCRYGKIMVSGGSITSAGRNGTIYNTAENASIIVTGGEITATASSAIWSNVATSTVTIGNNTDSVIADTNTPIITGGGNGICMTNGTLNFYDGVIIGRWGSGHAINKVPNDVPEGYVVQKTLVDGSEVAFLKPEYVTSGAMTILDAENNNGGSHSGSTTTWTALKGANGAVSNATWGDNYLQFNGTSSQVMLGQMNSDYQTLDVTFSVDSLLSHNQYMIANLEGAGIGVGIIPSGKLFVYCHIAGAYRVAYSSTVVNPGQIYNVSGLFDGTTLKIYVNGLFEKSNEQSGKILAPSTTQMALGGNPYGNAVTDERFAGKIYTAAVYSRALTDAEVKQNSDAGLAMAGEIPEVAKKILGINN